MRYRFHPWQLAALLILFCAVVISGISWYRKQSGTSAAEMTEFLPPGNGALLYIDVRALRDSGVLDAVAGRSPVAEDAEYRKFVDDTHFDYQQDLDAVAALFRDKQSFFVLRGRFDYASLKSYAAAHGGSCLNGFCYVGGSRPDRRISFYPISSSLMAMAVSSDNWAALQVSRKMARPAAVIPSKPVWMSLTGPALNEIPILPTGTRAFANALQNAQALLFTAGPSGDHLAIDLSVTCETAEKASALLVQLEDTTSTLRKWLAREHKEPNPRDLSGVLTAGSFRREDRRVLAEWPLQKEFLSSFGNTN